MFAVPGWSVSCSALKTQTSEATTTQTPTSVESAVVLSSKASKKRKRSSGKSKPSKVDSTNLANLWEIVIEKKSKPKDPSTGRKHARKRRKIFNELDDGAPALSTDTISGENNTIEPKEKRKRSKDKGREKKEHVQPNSNAPQTGPKSIAPSLALQPVAQLTSLQASMRQKLVSARFRHLNQTLYTTPSSHSLELFQQNPEMFHEYHEGFRKQVEVWPENPVDDYVAQIRRRGMQRVPAHGKSKDAANGDEGQKSPDVLPLPRTDGICYIADLGCGDAGLSQGLEKYKKKLKLQIFSYDLQSTSPLVTKADIANLPLEDGSVDVAIFCLALMGTNWIDFIEEAFRILRWKGELWIAEIKSRFGRLTGKVKRVGHSVGNRKKPSKEIVKNQEEDADNADLLVEVDGHEDNRGGTDVSAFVEVLRKRGFALQNDRAVDFSNKMFVKMNFVKRQMPIKGKCVPVPKEVAEIGIDTRKKKPKPKFLDAEEVTVSSEASVLKPCVYKLR